jgi:hypothetical protein
MRSAQALTPFGFDVMMNVLISIPRIAGWRLRIAHDAAQR